NVLLPSVQPPWTGGASTPGPKAGFKYQLDGGIYELSGDCTVGSGETMLVNNNCALWVKGNFTLSGIMNLSVNATLKLYVSGAIDTTSAKWDKSAAPSDLIIYGLPTCKIITLDTGSKMHGVIYAPQADLSLKGSATFYGSS